MIDKPTIYSVQKAVMDHVARLLHSTVVIVDMDSENLKLYEKFKEWGLADKIDWPCIDIDTSFVIPEERVERPRVCDTVNETFSRKRVTKMVKSVIADEFDLEDASSVKKSTRLDNIEGYSFDRSLVSILTRVESLLPVTFRLGDVRDLLPTHDITVGHIIDFIIDNLGIIAIR